MNAQQQAARDRAVQVLQHYVRVLFDKAGASASYTGDTSAELEGIVDDIILAATIPEKTAHEIAVEDLSRRMMARTEEGVGRLHDGGSVEEVSVEQLADPRD